MDAEIQTLRTKKAIVVAQITDGPIHKQAICDSEETWVTLPIDKPETPRSFHDQPVLQDGEKAEHIPDNLNTIVDQES